MQKCNVFLDNRKEWNNWWLHALTAKDVAILGHVSRRVKEILKVSKVLFILAWQLLPCTSESCYWCQIKTTGGKKHFSITSY